MNLTRYSVFLIALISVLLIATQPSYAISVELNEDQVTVDDSDDFVSIDYTVSGESNEGYIVTVNAEEVSGDTDLSTDVDGRVVSDGSDMSGSKRLFVTPDTSGNFEVWAEVESKDDDSDDTSNKKTVTFTETEVDNSVIELCDDDISVGNTVSLVLTMFSALGPVFGTLFFIGMTVADSARMSGEYKEDRRRVLLYGFSVPVGIGFIRVIGNFLIDSDISCYFPGG